VEATSQEKENTRLWSVRYSFNDISICSNLTFPLDIRWYKNSDVYKKNTRHCIYGQDADLIMLSLLSHEPNFTIIREEVKYKREQVEGIVRNEFILTNNFQMLYLPVLRQYLDKEFKETISKMELEYNLERVIDDIIFFCFFVGNDFLPSLSVLDIAEASVDTLFDLYKVTLPEIGDYITENGLIYWDRAEKLIKALATHELATLHSRMQKIMNFEKRAEDQEAQFLKGEERIQYFRLKEKRQQLMSQKKQKLLETLIKENKDKEFKEAKFTNNPRELKRMKFDSNSKGLKKRRGPEPKIPKGNNKYNFEVLMNTKDDDEEQDLDWLDDQDRGEADKDDEEEYAKTKSKEIEKKLEKSQPATETTKEEAKEPTNAEETIDTSKKTNAGEGEGDATTQELSDLGIHDISDGDVSVIDLEEIADIEGIVQGTLSRDLIVQLKLAEESRKKNQDFVKNLCIRYKENPESAKAYYYKEKVDFDVYTEDGKENRDDMLRQYLIGMQWVLFYYYKGVQHWGFYYKHHYPPMISDIKDIEILLGSTKIENFDMCEGENRPFFPYQQLLTILPPDSIENLLPKCYYDYFIKDPKFDKFYPLTFDMDLNGRSMPWEAIVLIPFIDEQLLLQHEAKLKEEGKMVMEQKDIDRNMRGYDKLYSKQKTLESFPIPERQFKGFEFGDSNKCKVIEQSPDSDDYVGKNFIDYKTTDTSIVCDFPSLENLPISKVALIGREMKGTRFEIPQIYIDENHNQELNLQTLSMEFVEKKRDAIYVDYPAQHEAFIYCIVTHEAYYNIFDCWMRGTKKGLVSETTDNQWYEATSLAEKPLRKDNFHCQKFDVIVGFNRVIGVKWNERTNNYEKDYKSEVEYLPLQFVSLERDPDHYLNLEPRLKDPLSRFEANKNCMVLDQTLFGLSAQIKGPTEGEEEKANFKYYDLNINRAREENKLRELFFAKNTVHKMHLSEPRYTSIHSLCKSMDKNYTVVNRITSSIFIKYTENKERKTVDIGLKLRNNSQKIHIPMDVIYSESLDKYTNKPTQFWGFSDLACDVIFDYLHTFKWLEPYIEARSQVESQSRGSKYKPGQNKYNTLEDAMPFIKTEEERIIELKKLTDYLENNELTKRSFVPAGFRFLSNEVRDSIESQITNLKENEKGEVPSELKKVDPRSMFSETYPFWNSPFMVNVKGYKFGDRVANINTHRRKYIPFGSIGTVIGTTLDSVIVRFDEPNVSLTDVHDTCPPYTGAVVPPESMINLTQQAEIRFQNKKVQNYRNVEEKKGQHHGHQQNYRQGQNPHGGHQNKGGYHGNKPAHEENKHGGDNKGYTKYSK